MFINVFCLGLVVSGLFFNLSLRLHYVVGHLSNLCADNNKSIHMAVDEIIEDVLSLELNESSSISAQSSHNPSSSNAEVPMEGNLDIVTFFFNL